MYSKKKKTHFQRKKPKVSRKFVVLSLILLLVVISTLGWFIIQGVIPSVVPGDKQVSDVPKSDNSSVSTQPTNPTMTVQGQLSSPRAVVYDETHSTVLYQCGETERCSPASLTKLMTAAVASEYCSADEVFTAGSELGFVDAESSTAGLKPGYQLTRDMIIDALLLPSGNDAAYVIAAHVGRKVANDPSLGDIEAILQFVDLMNQTAEKIGAANTHFANPDGIYYVNHYTCAQDMLLIAKNARKYDNLKATVAKQSVQYALLSGQSVSWENSNLLIKSTSPYYFEGATGMKTGYTEEAGYCVVASAQRNGIDIIMVVMGGTSPDSRWRDSTKLFKEAFRVETANTAASN